MGDDHRDVIDGDPVVGERGEADHRGDQSPEDSAPDPDPSVDSDPEPVVLGEAQPARRSPRRQVREAPDREMDATRLYLGEIGFSPLLSAEEEVYFSRRAQRGDGRPKMLVPG